MIYFKAAIMYLSFITAGHILFYAIAATMSRLKIRPQHYSHLGHKRRYLHYFYFI